MCDTPGALAWFGDDRPQGLTSQSFMWSPHRRNVHNGISVGIFLFADEINQTQIISCIVHSFSFHIIYGLKICLCYFFQKKTFLTWYSFSFISKKVTNGKNLLYCVFLSNIRSKLCTYYELIKAIPLYINWLYLREMNKYQTC